MNAKNLKGLTKSLIVTVGLYSICPAIMVLKSRDFDRKLAVIKSLHPTARTIAFMGAK